MTPEELHREIDAGASLVLLDVRTPDEYAAGHIPGALNVPFWRVLAGAGPAGVPKDAPLVVYCGHGPRAQMAMLGLRLRGFTNVSELDGHWAGWQRLGLHESTGPEA